MGFISRRNAKRELANADRILKLAKDLEKLGVKVGGEKASAEYQLKLDKVTEARNKNLENIKEYEKIINEQNDLNKQIKEESKKINPLLKLRLPWQMSTIASAVVLGASAFLPISFPVAVVVALASVGASAALKGTRAIFPMVPALLSHLPLPRGFRNGCESQIASIKKVQFLQQELDAKQAQKIRLHEQKKLIPKEVEKAIKDVKEYEDEIKKQDHKVEPYKAAIQQYQKNKAQIEQFYARKIERETERILNEKIAEKSNKSKWDPSTERGKARIKKEKIAIKAELTSTMKESLKAQIEWMRHGGFGEEPMPEYFEDMDNFFNGHAEIPDDEREEESDEPTPERSRERSREENERQGDEEQENEGQRPRRRGFQVRPNQMEGLLIDRDVMEPIIKSALNQECSMEDICIAIGASAKYVKGISYKDLKKAYKHATDSLAEFLKDLPEEKREDEKKECIRLGINILNEVCKSPDQANLYGSIAINLVPVAKKYNNKIKKKVDKSHVPGVLRDAFADSAVAYLFKQGREDDEK